MNDNLDRPLIQLGNTNHEDEVTATIRRKPLILVGLSILLVVAVSTASFFSYGAGVSTGVTTFEVHGAPAVPDVGEEEDESFICLKPGAGCWWVRGACCNSCHCPYFQVCRCT